MMTLSAENFRKISSIAYQASGLLLTPEKREMARGRLIRRLKSLQLESFDEYVSYISSSGGLQKELGPMLNELTTHKTDFFRENDHFLFLRSQVLPGLADQRRGEWDEIRFWSAGCATGEEPYSIAISMEEFRQSRQMRYTVIGSDISREVLEQASKAVYAADDVAAVPQAVLHRYFLKNKDAARRLVRVIPEIRNKVQFQYCNLIDEHPAIDGKFHVIFCRNVLIYFDRKTQETVLRKMAAALLPGGYFFHGHSESLNGMNLPLQRIQATVYRKVRSEHDARQ